MIPTQDAEGKWGYPMQNINQEVLQRKADLGTSVHAAISSHVRDEFCVTSSRIDGYLTSYLNWEKAMDLHFRETETRLYNELMSLTGCIDMMAGLGPAYPKYTIDFKCTVSPDPVKWPIQAALYHFLATSNNLQVDKTVLFVQLDPKGEAPKVHEYEVTKSLTATALSFYNAYTYLTKK